MIPDSWQSVEIKGFGNIVWVPGLNQFLMSGKSSISSSKCDIACDVEAWVKWFVALDEEQSSCQLRSNVCIH